MHCLFRQCILNVATDCHFTDPIALRKKMYFLNAWDCSATVWDNFMAYEGELFSVDNEDDHWKYYNCNLLTYESK